MHILQTYSLLSGAKINKCFIEEESFDLPSTDYVLIHPCCTKAPARQYSKWQDVISLLKQDESFKKPIVQIGSILDKLYDNIDINLLGKTNANQLAYLIKHCALLICYDSFPMHLASYYDKKIVCLFSYYSKNSKPYFSSKKNISILEPDFTIYKPSLLYDDTYRLIDTISPNTIYNNIKRLLNE
jgi:ADP-heptose:LPS heptosyltransferase